MNAKSALRPPKPNRQPLEDKPVPVRLKLSALWASVMFLYVYVDIFMFYKPGTIEDILVGRVWEFDISQGWALGALALMTFPSLMVCVSLLAKARTARWVNIVVASLFALVTIGGTVGETWAFYWFGSAVELGLLVLIIRYAWTWPASVPTSGIERESSPGPVQPAIVR
ncbi:MAG: DUF6326 family protein [Acidimicrobiia bacterium]